MADPDIQRRLGTAVSASRRARGMTQERLAEVVGVSTEWVSQVERGVGVPSLDMLVSIATALGVRPGALVDATFDAPEGRAEVQRLLATAGDLPDWALRVLTATATTMVAEIPAKLRR